MSEAVCWFCSQAVSAARAEVEAVIEARSAEHGGPFRTMTCPACRTRCGALRNRRGAWLLYPLEGAAEPTLIDRIVPRTSRAHLQRSRAWWLRNAAHVERFRHVAPVVAPRAATSRDVGAPPPKPHGARRRAAAARPSRAKPAAPSGPRTILGVGPEADLADVKRAWRAAVKRWHPDRIPTTDPVVVGEAVRRFKELRAAYEALVAELSG